MIKFIFQETAVKKPKDIASVSFVFQKGDQVLVMPNGQKSLVVGIENRKTLNRRKFYLACRRIISLAKANRIKKLAIPFKNLAMKEWKMGDKDIAQASAINFEMADFEFIKYKSPLPEGWNFIEEIIITGKKEKKIQKMFDQGQIIGEEVNKCRSLANTPGGDLTPKQLAEEAKKAVSGLPIQVKVFGKEKMEALGMGGILGVSRGSEQEPQFIILEYKPVKKARPIVFVGKGVTFDSGGLGLKPTNGMSEMHLDMSGGAAVIHAIAAAARLKIKRNLIGLIPAAENMPSGSSYRPGDILKTLSGKTVEVVSTDAEGRIILADALTFAERYQPRLVIDVATLTSAAMIALGQRASAIFTQDEKLAGLLADCGEQTGDYVWPLPLWDEYEEEIKGTFGDLANSQKTKYGDAIAGAMFLRQFTKNYSWPWVHIDIAPRMTATEDEYLAKGAAGTPVRLLIKLAENWHDESN